MTMMGKRDLTVVGKLWKTSRNIQVLLETCLTKNTITSVYCRYCTDTKTIFTTSVMLKNHISLMHGIKNPDLGQMPKSSIQEFQKDSDKVTIHF